MTPSKYRPNWKWSADMAPHARQTFAGQNGISQNYSQAWQDIFVLTALDGRRGGSYLEAGGHVPVDNNNTYLLHREFGWDGVSLKLDAQHFPLWKRFRPDCRFVIADALRIDYAAALPQWFDDGLRRLDYLQLDIDPSINTLSVLKSLPLDSWRFSVITFETDIYAGDARPRDESRDLLKSHGYELVAKDVGVLFTPVSSSPIPFEDWWVDPVVVRPEIIDQLKSINKASSWPQDLLFAQ